MFVTLCSCTDKTRWSRLKRESPCPSTWTPLAVSCCLLSTLRRRARDLARTTASMSVVSPLSVQLWGRLTPLFDFRVKHLFDFGGQSQNRISEHRCYTADVLCLFVLQWHFFQIVGFLVYFKLLSEGDLLCLLTVVFELSEIST